MLSHVDPKPAVAFLDVGQTGTKARLVDGIHLIQSVLAGVRTDGPLPNQLADLVRALIADWRQPVDTIAAGVSGLIDATVDADELLRAVAPLGVRRVVLAHDSITSYLGALGDHRGAVVAAGTGVVTLGVGADRLARVDGWGNIMGDAGSGYWIGRAGLEAGMRALDGRATPTRLSALITHRWADPAHAYIDLQQDPDRVRTVASFARAVIELADSDSTAATICSAAARELSISADAALRTVGGGPEAWSDGPEVAAVGGLFDADRIRDSFERLMRASWPNAVMAVPRGNGLDGAQLLPELPRDHALRQGLGDVSISV